jgi:predicted transcriptional regulator
MEFEKQIRNLGWNLTAFSRLAEGISPQTIKRIDRGENFPRPETLQRILRGIKKIQREKLEVSLA